MPPCHLMRPKTNVMVAFLLDIIGMSVHHSHFSACHSLRSVIKTKATEFIRHRTNFRPAKKFDQTLCSHGTVQYFRAVHTEPTKPVEFDVFLSEVLPSAHAQSATIANPNWRLPT